MSKKTKAYEFFDYDCDLNHRVIWLGSQHVTASGNESGVDASLAEKTVKALYLMNVDAPNGDKPINILLNNPGGDEFHCAAIYDAIRNSQNEVIITVYGMAMSAASILMQAAKIRKISASSTIMIHYGSWGYHDHPQIMYKWADQGKKLDSWMEQIYLSRIREKHPEFKLKELKKMLQYDTFFTAQEAVDIGLADEVV